MVLLQVPDDLLPKSRRALTISSRCKLVIPKRMTTSRNQKRKSGSGAGCNARGHL
ncbi:hypothetical protein PO124_28980 [Bacillus licheniformis]|nr:hypothetical protein [Bacillus licheniformis]